MPLHEYISPNFHPNDYLPVDPADIVEFQETDNPGISLANGNLPMPILDGQVPIAFTHIDGIDDENLLDPSNKEAVSDNRDITHQGLILMRRADNLNLLTAIGVAIEDRGWVSPGLKIVRFDVDKPVLAYERRRGLTVQMGGAAISSAMRDLFPQA